MHVYIFPVYVKILFEPKFYALGLAYRCLEGTLLELSSPERHVGT